MGFYGLFLFLVGVFRTDPWNGFPPDAITPSKPSGHAVIHALGGLFTFISLAATLAVFARLFPSMQKSGLAFRCAASGAIVSTCFFGGIHNSIWILRMLRLATLIGWMAASVVAVAFWP